MSTKLLLFFSLLLSKGIAIAQSDLRSDQSFFISRSKDYAAWVSENELGHFFSFEKIIVTQEKVTLVFISKFNGEKSGDSLRIAWNSLRSQYYRTNGTQFHAAMLSKMAFQLELRPESAEIIIRASNSKYYIRVFGEHENVRRVTARWEEFGDSGMGNGSIKIPVGQLNDVFRSGKATFGDNTSVDLTRVRRAVRTFFKENYENKGTIIWNARIDSTSEIYNTFSYTVTRITHEVLKSHSFFELHQIDIEITDGNNGLEVKWTFQAKYGGGLIFPPRDDSNDYHDFETSIYKEQFRKYQTLLFNRLEASLKKI